jgi:hypothetical protein
VVGCTGFVETDHPIIREAISATDVTCAVEAAKTTSVA